MASFTVRVPAPTRELTSNLAGLAGFAGLTATVGGLAGLWWALGFASLVLVGLSWAGARPVVVEHTAAAANTAPTGPPPAAASAAPPPTVRGA